MANIDRNRVTVWPLDVWAKRAEYPEGDTLYFANQKIMDWRIPAGFGHVAWIDQGGDRGPLLRNKNTGIFMMLLPTRAIRSVHERKVKAALSTLTT